MLVPPEIAKYISIVEFFDASPSTCFSTFNGDFSMSKRNAKPADLDIFFHALGVQDAETANADDALLSSMLGDLDEVIEEADEVVEPETLEAAVADIHKAEAVQAVYADQDDEVEETAEADKPSTDALPDEKTVKAKKAKQPKEPKEPKAPRVTSTTHKPDERLMALLGGDKTWLGFIKSDDTLAAERRADQFLADMHDRDAIADKVKDKAIMLLTWIASGKDTSALNEVLLRSFSVLFKDGELTSGNKGNLQTNLLSKPYSPGTAASQANQMFMLFPILGITQREKGRMVINPDSAIVDVMKLKMGL
jgi:hypothetical protein